MRVKKADFLSMGAFKTTQGWCAAAWTDKGVSALVIPQTTQEKAIQKISGHLPALPYYFWQKPLRPVPSFIVAEAKRALAAIKFKTIPVDLFSLTRFQNNVLSATC